MNSFIRKSINTVALVGAISASCTPSKTDAVMSSAEKASGQLPGAIGTPASMALPPLAASEAATGEMLAAVSAATDSVIKTAGSTKGSAAFKEVALAIPKGSLSGSGTLTIAEGSSLASPLLAEALGIAEVAQASPTVIINANAVSIVNPLTIALPMGTGLSLDGGALQVVAIVPGSNGSQTLNVLPPDKVKISETAVYAEITEFGAYQAVRMSSQPKTTSTPTTLAPVKSPGGGATTAEIGAALLLATPDGLPNCTPARQGSLYYIISLREFHTCDSGAWVVIDLRGSKGERGEVGAKGEQGETGLQGIAGQKGETGDRGPEGPVGPMGPKAPDPVPYYSTQSSTYRFAEGNFVNIFTETQYVNYGGAVLRTCTTESWQEWLTNGMTYKTRSFGDAGCLLSETSQLLCDAGFVGLAGQCVAACSNSSLSQCNSQQICEANRMIWDAGTGSCKGYCTETNLGACVSESTCRSAGLIWSSGQCLTRCSNYDLSSCQTEARCTGSGMTWGTLDSDTGAQGCLGSCTEWGGSLKTCNTLALCQQRVGEYDGKTYYYPGYWKNGACESSCDAGQIASSTGCQQILQCEVDASGLPTHWQSNNICTPTTYSTIEQTVAVDTPKIEIKGEYQGPTLIKSGVYDVTDNATFYGPVVIEAGTRMIATGSHQLSFRRTVQIRGTPSSRVVFETKDLSTKWGGFEFYNIHDYSARVTVNPFKLDGTYFAGTKVEYLTITGATGASMQLAGYFSNLMVDGMLRSFRSTEQSDLTRNSINANGLYLAHSTLPIPENAGSSYSNLTVIFDNDFLPGASGFYLQKGLLWGNRFASGSGSITAFDQGVFLFNRMDSLNCTGMAFGNSSRSPNFNENDPSCKGGENSVNADNSDISDKTFAYWHDVNMMPIQEFQTEPFRVGQQTRDFKVTLLTADGLAASSIVSWTAEYVDNLGNRTTVRQADGETFNFTPVASGIHTLKITNAPNSGELIGILSKSLNVSY